MRFTELLPHLSAVAQDQGSTIYLVGGCVRDGLLGRPLVDVDLAIRGDASAYAHVLADRLGGSYAPLGERFGTARVVLHSEGGEVVQIDCTAFAATIENDLLRRDFTIDAMAVDPEGFDGDWGRARLIDPCGGRSDLEQRVLRLVSPGALDDDPLRLLRAVRLTAEMHLALDAETAFAIKARAQLLERPASERQRDEIGKIFAAEGTAHWLALMDGLGLLDVVIPELAQSKGVEQPKEHHWDVYNHQIEAVAAVEALMERRVSKLLEPRPYLHQALTHVSWPPSIEGYFGEDIGGGHSRKAILKLTALLHDIAKPATKTFEPSGRMRFFGHEELGAVMAKRILRRLRFGNHGIDAVTRMVDNHLRPGQWSEGGMPTPRALYRFFRDLGNVAIDTIFLNLADHLAARGPTLDLVRWRQHVDIANAAIAYYFDQQTRTAASRLVTGKDIMSALNLTPGPLVGQLLAEIEEAIAVGAVTTKEEALDLARRSLAA